MREDSAGEAGEDRDRLAEFRKAFGSESACAEHLRRIRWPKGFVCPRCGHREAWWIAPLRLMDCKNCRFRTSLTAGTVFHKSRISLLAWYGLIYLTTAYEHAVSVREMQAALHIRDYKTVWLMAHKVRQAMSQPEATLTLAGFVAVDRAWFVPAHGGNKDTEGSGILCAVSPHRDRRGRNKPLFVHAERAEHVSPRALQGFAERWAPRFAGTDARRVLATVRAHGWYRYSDGAEDEAVPGYSVALCGSSGGRELLPWIHRLLAHAREVVRTKHRGVADKHLPAYVVEASYRFVEPDGHPKRFEDLLWRCASCDTVTYREVTNTR